ncbi:MAG: cytochrome c [Pseudomonadales bacterium]|nr:cytochrome c [Pseudomonadales bacterium]NRA17418.1 cytochrome c [Oceanospirillaceae bacterium]
MYNLVKTASINYCNPLSLLLSVLLLSCASLQASEQTPQAIYNQGAAFAIGSPASATEIAGWDIDVRPDGVGLPEGSGSVEQGALIYEQKCAMCHGDFGEGAGRYPKLAGGEGSLQDARPEKTVGSYWPYTSTLWDYIRRAMPYYAPQSLKVDEVYSLTAYVLNLNDILDDDAVVDQQSLMQIKMPNRDGFYLDTRPDSQNQRCMQDCLKGTDLKLVSSLAEPEVNVD